jgi:hypothetical protein
MRFLVMKHQNIALFAALFAAWNCKIGFSSKFASPLTHPSIGGWRLYMKICIFQSEMLEVIFFKAIPSIG